MERTTSIKEAKEIFGPNFIGPDELISISEKIKINKSFDVPPISFDIEYLRDRSKDYLLVLGVSEFADGSPMNILFLRKYFGVNPVSEPCFYNQDWYLQEEFVNYHLENKWFLIRKNVFEDSRAMSPEYLSEKYKFPPAILCAYTFFVHWFLKSAALWPNDFVWCEDIDHNGDRIYVGRYYDISGVNKNGFNIHRHLRVRNNYGSV